MRDGKLAVVVGSSRSGKSAWVKKQIKRHPRVLVWDIKAEYKDGFTQISNKKALIDFLKAHQNKPFKACYVANDLKDFDYWSRVAYTIGRIKPIIIVSEELADVTSPAKAPAGWGMLVRKILGFGCDIYAITQRPAESDKTIMGNATYFHVGRLARAGDRSYMAKEMDIPVVNLNVLKPLEWIEKHSCGAVKRGKLRF
jgi:hypothetical protein